MAGGDCTADRNPVAKWPGSMIVTLMPNRYFAGQCFRHGLDDKFARRIAASRRKTDDAADARTVRMWPLPCARRIGSAA